MREPANRNIRASVVRSAAGRPARKTNGFARAAMSGIRSTPGASAQLAFTSGLKPSASLAVDDRHTRAGTIGEETMLTYGLKTARDLLEKLKRDCSLLDEEVTSDRFFNFVTTGYSIIDWLKHEPTVAQADVEAMYRDPWIKICGDIANASKHFSLSTRKPITSNVESQQGWGVARFGKGGWGKAKKTFSSS